MSDFPLNRPAIIEQSPTRVMFGARCLDHVGSLAKNEGAATALLVCDPGVAAAGYLQRAITSLDRAGIRVVVFDGVRENPTTETVARGIECVGDRAIDFVIGLGGGSAMDCAKGINLLHTNGGSVADYWGINKATKPLMPSILIPTTAGTGSEAQSFALISDATTHRKMACGDRRHPALGGLRPRVAILDPELIVTQPARVAAATALDALSHAVESAGCNARTPLSISFSREAWVRLSRSFEPFMRDGGSIQACGDMLLGAHLSGCAIEQSMLGAAHACANPLTAMFGITHGFAVAMMLPSVIRYNAETGENPYEPICDDPLELANQIEQFASMTGLKLSMSAFGVNRADLWRLAPNAATQWTAGFNPRTVGADDLLTIFEHAWS